MPSSAITRAVLVIFPGALGDLICLMPTLRANRATPSGGSARADGARAELARFGNRPAWNRSWPFDIGPARSRTAIRGARRTGGRRGAKVSSDRSHRCIRSLPPMTRISAAALDAVTEGRAGCFSFRPAGAGHRRRWVLAGNRRRRAGPPLDCSIELDREDLDLAEDRLARLGLEAGRYMLVPSPGSGSPAKNWPAENFVALAKTLASRIRSLVILGPAESSAWTGSLPRAVCRRYQTLTLPKWRR